jgi:hypothetical protein
MNGVERKAMVRLNRSMAYSDNGPLKDFVREACLILLKVERKFGIRTNYHRDRFVEKKIHKDPRSTYYRTFASIIRFLIARRGKFTNSLEFLLEDYFTALYKSRHNNQSFSITALGPGYTNKLRFEEYIAEQEEDFEPYWINTPGNYLDRLGEAIQTLKNTPVPIDRKSCLTDIPNITEISRHN